MTNLNLIHGVSNDLILIPNSSPFDIGYKEGTSDKVLARKGDERARGAEELEKKSKIEEYNRKKRLEYE